MLYYLYIYDTLRENQYQEMDMNVNKGKGSQY